MADAKLELELTLNNPDELFHAPESDPLHGVFEERSGVERILDELRANPSARAVSVKIRLPAEHLTDTLEPQICAALARYCDAQLQQMTRVQAPVRRLGIRTILFGAIFIGGSLLLSVLFAGTVNVPQFLGTFLVEGFLIAGWVALWYATEIWLFDIWEKHGERRHYERLKQLTLEIHPAR